MVIVIGRQQSPALVMLALDVGGGRLPLGVQGIKFLLQTIVRRLARVDLSFQPRSAPLKDLGFVAGQLGINPSYTS